MIKDLKFFYDNIAQYLHSINTISLRSTWPQHKTEINNIAETNFSKHTVWQWSRALTQYHSMGYNPVPYPSGYLRESQNCGETNIANRYCRRNAGCPVHSSPHREFQKCDARISIRTGQTEENFQSFSKQRFGGGERLETKGITAFRH